MIAAREAGKRDRWPITIEVAAAAATKKQLNYLRELPRQEQERWAEVQRR